MQDKPQRPMSPQARAWYAENKDAIDAYNERVAKHGTLIQPIWLTSKTSSENSDV